MLHLSTLAARAFAVCLAAAALMPVHAQTATQLAGTWAASTDGLPNVGLSAQTARNIFRTSVGGTGVQVQLSNVFGDRDVTISNVTLGLQANGASLVAGSVSGVTFNGKTSVVIPKGQRVLSDVMPRTLAPQAQLAVSLFVPNPSGAMTGHSLGMEDVWFSSPGVDATSSIDSTQFPYATGGSNGFKVYVDAIYLKQANAVGTVAALGDSITDGVDGGYNKSGRWTNRLAERLLASGIPMGVMNEAIGGNTVTIDRPGSGGGQSAPTRLDRDVLAIQGLSTVVVFEGINDLLGGVAGSAIRTNLKSIVDRIHAAGKCVVGGTITPAGNLSPAQNADRVDLNDWIRTGGVYDGVADFDAALRDPANPSRLLAVYDTGDSLHPSPAGQRAMGDAVDLASLQCPGLTNRNLALGKPATQSTLAFDGHPARAVDGVTNGNYNNVPSTTHTAGAYQDWWQVDLGQLADIDSVRLWNRTDCCASRLSNFHVLVSSTDMTGRTLAQLLADPAIERVAVGSLNGNASLNLPLPGGTKGRYVRVQLDGQDYLSLAEVQVYGRTSVNLALGKPATQSSEAFGGPAARAVDGSTDGNYLASSTTHTEYNAQGWWQIDLGQAYLLDTATLWNRTDCCADRLSNFYVLASPTDMSGRTLGQLLADPAVKQVQIASLNGSPSVTLALGGVPARYVRVQLAGTNYLSLTEVQLFGR